jgi:16S rRNA (cytosine967-C5)-methyltransferase
MDRLTREDRGLAHELVMSTLRWQSALDLRLSQFCSQPLARLDAEVLAALRLGACQLLRLDRIPAHAAVGESVELVKQAGKRSAAPLVNAVLRKVAAAPKAASAAAAEHNAHALAGEFAHPEWLVARWIDTYQYDAARAICSANQRPATLALRLCAPDAESGMQREGIVTEPGRLLRSARRFVSGDLAHSAISRDGHVAIQNEASQLVAALVGGGKRILDCCAAPGGKTLAIAQRNPDAEITAIELHEHRARLLRDRVAGRNVEVIAADVTAIEFARKFDCVLADVPCSGTGTLSGNPEIRWRLTPEQLAGFGNVQAPILKAAAAAVAPGGRLVYSTCSLEADEGEKVVEEFLEGEPAYLLLPCGRVLEELAAAGELVWPEPRSLTRGPYLRTLPGVHPCDGFFAAILQRSR